MGQIAVRHVSQHQQQAIHNRFGRQRAHDVRRARFLQLRTHHDLALIALAHLLAHVGRQIGTRLFDRYQPLVEGQFLRQPHPRHASFAQDALDVIFAVQNGFVGF